jgi:hypothetical protein
MATFWSVGDSRYAGFIIGRSFVSADVRVMFPRDRGATRVARMVAYW